MKVKELPPSSPLFHAYVTPEPCFCAETLFAARGDIPTSPPVHLVHVVLKNVVVWERAATFSPCVPCLHVTFEVFRSLSGCFLPQSCQEKLCWW